MSRSEKVGVWLTGQFAASSTKSLTDIAESLVRIADALEAMKPQPVEATLEEFDAAGFADRIAEALKSGAGKGTGVGGIVPSAQIIGDREGVELVVPYHPPAEDDQGGRCR